MDAAEAVTGRQVARQLYEKGVANRISKQLLDLEVALVDDLAKALARLSALDETRLVQGNYTTERLRRLIAQVQDFSVSWARIVREQTDAAGLDLVAAEIEFERQFLATFATDSAVTLSLDAVINPRTVFAAARRRPMDIKVIKEVFPLMQANVKRRVVDSLRTSYQAGDSIGQATSRLRSDKQLGIHRRAAEGLTRTALNHYSSQATKDALQELGVTMYTYVSTLDSRTTVQCMSLSGRVFSFSNSRAPIPPVHFACRSSITPYWGEEFDGVQTSNGASGKELVPASLDYSDWLRRQPKSFQRDILSKDQYTLFAAGQDIDKFTDQYSSIVYTSEQLRQRYRLFFQ